MNRANQIVADLVVYADALIGILSLLYILLCQIGCSVIYPTMELILQYPVLILYLFLLYILILEKNKKVFDKLSCCPSVNRSPIFYQILLLQFRDRLMRNNALKKLRIAMIMILTILAILVSILKTPDLQAFGTKMYYDSDELSEEHKKIYQLFYITQILALWFILFYHVLYGCGRFMMFITLSVFCCPCILLAVLLFKTGNINHINQEQIPVNPDQDLIDQGYQGPIGYIKKQRQEIQDWIDMKKLRYSQVQKLVEKQNQIDSQKTQSSGGSMGINCSICISQFKPKDWIIQLKCNEIHVFHQECLKVWALSKFTCPLCRKNILKPFDDVNIQKTTNIEGVRNSNMALNDIENNQQSNLEGDLQFNVNLSQVQITNLALQPLPISEIQNQFTHGNVVQSPNQSQLSGVQLPNPTLQNNEHLLIQKYIIEENEQQQNDQQNNTDLLAFQVFLQRKMNIALQVQLEQ
eukprot:403346095